MGAIACCASALAALTCFSDALQECLPCGEAHHPCFDTGTHHPCMQLPQGCIVSICKSRKEMLILTTSEHVS